MWTWESQRTRDSTVESQSVLPLFPTSVFIIIKHWAEFRLFWKHYLFADGSMPWRPGEAQFSDICGKVEHTGNNNLRSRACLRSHLRVPPGIRKWGFPWKETVAPPPPHKSTVIVAWSSSSVHRSWSEEVTWKPNKPIPKNLETFPLNLKDYSWKFLMWQAPDTPALAPELCGDR